MNNKIIFKTFNGQTRFKHKKGRKTFQNKEKSENIRENFFNFIFLTIAGCCKGIMNYGLISLSVVVCGFVIKLFGFYSILAIVSCLVVSILSFFSVILSSSSEQSLSFIIRNPLEQQTKVKLGLNCK